MLRWMVILFVGILSAAPAAAQDDLPRFDIVYGSGQLPRQTLDVYLPEEAEAPYPVIFAIHGGGYLFGSKLIVAPFAAHFAELGYAVVTPNYRLSLTAPYPAPISDITCALAWVHAHADQYGFDLSRIAIVGESAGGNAAALLGTTPSLEPYLEGCPHPVPPYPWADGIVAYYPITDFSTCETNCRVVEGVLALYLGVEQFSPEVWGDASPLAGIDGSEPPFLIIHGDADDVVPHSESLLLAERLQMVDVPVELLLIEGAGHGFISELLRPAGYLAAEAVAVWLQTLWAKK